MLCRVLPEVFEANLIELLECLFFWLDVLNILVDDPEVHLHVVGDIEGGIFGGQIHVQRLASLEVCFHVQ